MFQICLDFLYFKWTFFLVSNKNLINMSTWGTPIHVHKSPMLEE